MEELLRNEKALIAILKEADDTLLEEIFHCGCLCKEELDDILNLDNEVDSGLRARYLLRIIYIHIKRDKILLENFFCSKLGLYFLVATKDCSEIILSEKHIPLLTDALVECSYKWEEIGIGLGLRQNVIEECRKSSSNNTRLHKILVSWHKRNSNASLKIITEVLKKELVGMASLADNLEKRIKDAIVSKIPELDQRIVSRVVVKNNVEVLDGKSTLLCVHTPQKLKSRVRYQWTKDETPLYNGRHYSSVENGILLIKHACQGLEGQYTCCINNRSQRQQMVNLKITYSPEKQCLMRQYVKENEVPVDSWPPVGISTFINLALISEGKLNELDYSVRGDMDDILKSKELYKFEQLFSSYKSGALVLLEGRPGSGKTTLTHKIVKEWAIGPDVLYGASYVFLISLRMLNITKKDQTLSDLLDVFYNREHVELIVNKLEKDYGEGACFIIDGLDEYQTENSVITQLIDNKYLRNAMIIVASRPVGTLKLRRSHHTNRRIEVLGFSRDQISMYLSRYTFRDGRTSSELEAYLEHHINVLHMCYLPVHVAMVCYIYNDDNNIPNTETKIYELFTLLTIKRMLTRVGEVPMKPSLKHLNSETQIYFDNICKLAFDMTINSQQSIHHSKTAILPLSKKKCDTYSLGLVTVDSTAVLLNFEEVYSFLHLTFQEFLAAFYIANQDCEKQMSIIRENNDKKDMLMVWKFYFGIMNFSDSHLGHIQLILNSKPMTDVYKIHCAFESQQSMVCSSIMTTEILTYEDYVFSPTDFHAIGYVTSHASHPIKLILKNCILNENGLKSVPLRNIKYLSFRTNRKSQLKVLNGILKQCGSLETLDLLEQEFQGDDVLAITDGVTLPCLNVLKLCLPLTDIADVQSLKFNSSKFEQIQYKYKNNTRISHKRVLSDLLTVFEFEIVPLCEFPSNILSNLELDISRVTRFLELSSVILINCNIDDQGVEYLISNSNYKTVRLDVNKITDVGAKFICELMRNCCELKYLSLSCNMISDDGALAIVHALKDTPNLLELDLQGNHISEESKLAITCALKPFPIVQCRLNTTLQDEQSLYIWDAVTMEGPHKSVTRAFHCFKYLQTLNLNGHEGFEILDSRLLSLTGKGLKCCDSLKVLVLSNNRIGYGISEIADGLKYCSSLEVLDLHNNDINHIGATVLSDMLKNILQISPLLHPTSNLLELNLSNNKIGDLGAIDLAYGLECCRKLQSLDLASNGILVKGARAIFFALEKIVTLQEFKFSHNKCSCPLKGCVNLQTLCIENTDIPFWNASQIFKELQYCVNLQSLNISHNNIACVEGEVLAESLKCMKDLRFLKIGYNIFGSSELYIYSGLRHCAELQELHVEYNGLHKKVALFEALSNCLCLQKLILDGNKFVMPEVNSLILLLSNNESIKWISLKHSDMDNACTQSLLAGLTSCSNLQLLEVCICDSKKFPFMTSEVNNCKISVSKNCLDLQNKI